MKGLDGTWEARNWHGKANFAWKHRRGSMVRGSRGSRDGQTGRDGKREKEEKEEKKEKERKEREGATAASCNRDIP